MTHTIDFRPRLRLAAEALTEHGWTRGTERDSAGQMCLTGAIKFCAPQNGDEYIIREVLRKRDRAENWNDDEASDAAEVIDYLATADITDADLVDTFGPQVLEIVALVRSMFTLTGAQWSAAWYAARSAARSAAWDAARYAARYAARDTMRDAARDAAWYAARSAARSDAWSAAWNAAWNAAGALVVRDKIGQHGFTQEHYDTLTGPWRKTIGKIHPDDLDIYEPEDHS